ncbi:MAG: recombination regulator RecX [Treponema sp.]|jgi:regulatory protein|nr:recombination regulator RecX [Treponema sp.]
MVSAEPDGASSSANAKQKPVSLTVQAALRLVARAEQCEAGISRKLTLRRHPPPAIREALSYLVKNALVDDRRYARLWLKSRLAWSAKTPRMLVASLLARGIKSETAKASLAEALTPEVEKELIRRLLAKKKLAVNTKTRAFLRCEGFSAGSIREAEEEP